MKQLLCTALFLTFLIHFSFSQNTYPYPSTGNVGIGTTAPVTKLHVAGNGASIDFGGDSAPTSSQGLAIQAATGGRSLTNGAQLEFIIPALTDGTGFWGQARIITVAGTTYGGDATGKMILGTRRMFDKLGTGTASWYYGNDITIDGLGNVGIGTIKPVSALDVNGNISTTANSGIVFNGYYSAGWKYRSNGYANTVYQNGTGDFVFSSFNTNSAGTGAAATENKLMTVKYNGYVGIGTQTPDQLLTVNGTVHAKAVNVDLNVPAPDYVFEQSYKLLTLTEIKAYVEKNHHLPEMPSADEMMKNGMNLGDMNELLLKKVEELTLYLIDKDERERKQDKKIQDQEARILKLENMILSMSKSDK